MPKKFKKAAVLALLSCIVLSAAGCAAVPVPAPDAPEASGNTVSSVEDAAAAEDAENREVPYDGQSPETLPTDADSFVTEAEPMPKEAACREKETLIESGKESLVDIEEEAPPLAEVPQLSKVLVPEASGTVTYQTGDVTLDASNAGKGYIMVKYAGGNAKIKIRVVKKDGTTYTYDINARDSYEVFPLTEGSGSYTVSVFENVSGSQYAQAFGQVIDVQLENQFLPFLYPNQYVNFSDGSAAVKKAAELSAGAADDKAVVSSIYNYVISNITYDEQLAATVQSGYIPNVDAVLANKKGICYDYASLMTAMLRSQNIPTKMVWGYAGKVYHAWINVYLEEVGWVDNAIYFDGKDWKLMDPTFASSGKNSDAIKKYIGDGANYQQKYTY